MSKPREREHISDSRITGEEYEVLNKFLDCYREKEIIVADEYKTRTTRVPIEEPVIIGIENDCYKKMDFVRTIYYKGKPYYVLLSLVKNEEQGEPELRISDLTINTKQTIHNIYFDYSNLYHRDLMYEMLSLFQESRVISPELAHCPKMIVDHQLEDFIKGHKWAKLGDALSDRPDFKNALFYMPDIYHPKAGFHADFGTVLYQLIDFRLANKDELPERDLRGLDNLIIKLRKADLLRVNLFDRIKTKSSYNQNPILLDQNKSSYVEHSSTQMTVANTDLDGYDKVISECIRSLRI